MTQAFHIAPVAADLLPAVAALVFAHNRHADGAPRCLHADQGDTLAAHVSEIADLPADERCFVAAWTAGADPRAAPPVGAAGAEFEPGLGRAWVRAPLLAAAFERERADAAGAAEAAETAEAAEAASTLRERLLAALLAALPPAVTRLDAFVHPDDAGLDALFAHGNWTRVAVHHVMRAGRERGGPAPAWPDGLSVDSVSADDPRTAAAMPLHEALFPTSYLPPAALRASLDETHRLFAAERHGRVVGYLYAQRRPADADGYIDYLGVDASERGRGIAGALLRRALVWLLEDPAVRHVDLTVRTDRADALALYARAGFVRRHSGVQWRLERPGQPEQSSGPSGTPASPAT